MSDDDLLRDLYRADTAREASAAPTDCPVPHERMVALLEGRLPRRERLATMQQILDHPACREEFALLRSVRDAAGGRTGPPRPAFGSLRAAAAVAVLLVSASVVALLLRGGREEPLRGPAAGLGLIAPSGTVGNGPLGLVWHASADAERYDVTVADAGGVPVITRVTTDTSLAVGPLPPGRYRWWVRATRPDGTTGRSAIQPFTVAR
jgi:hypothetical protein